MPEVTLELLSQGKSETFTKPEVRLGRDPSCDVVFPSEKFPMVGRQHAVLRAGDGGWSAEDLQSTNGTFVNQVRIQRQQLAPGDTLRLGSDGPEIRVQFVDDSYAQTTRPAGLAAAPGVPVTQRVVPSASDLPLTRPAEFADPAGPQIASTKPSEPPPTRPVVAPTAIAATKPSPVPYNPPARTIHAPEAQMEHPDLIPGVLPPEKQDEISEEEEDPMNDEKLSLLRNLVIVMVGLVLVVGGIVISQTQDIRSDLKNLHEEAVRALKSSELDKRMKTMEDSMGALDGKLQQAEQRMSDRLDAESQALDGKIKNAEDHMMNRAERELPAIMDREVEKQKRKIIQEAQQGNLPH